MSTFVDPRTVDGYKSQRWEKQMLLLLGAMLDQQIAASGKNAAPPAPPAPEPKPPATEPSRRTLGVSNARR